MYKLDSGRHVTIALGSLSDNESFKDCHLYPGGSTMPIWIKFRSLIGVGLNNSTGMINTTTWSSIRSHGHSVVTLATHLPAC